MASDTQATTEQIQNILVPIDLKHESSWRKALPTAIDYARSCGARLHIVTVLSSVDLTLPTVHLPKDFNASRIKEVTQRLATLIKENVPGDVQTKHSVREGSIYREILAAAEADGTDVIVMASHRPSLKSYLLGVNAARVVRHAPCSVYVVREPT